MADIIGSGEQRHGGRSLCDNAIDNYKRDWTGKKSKRDEEEDWRGDD